MNHSLGDIEGNSCCSTQLGPLPVLDLTDAARAERLSSGMFLDQTVTEISRALYRTERHVLLVGEAGAGKQTAVHELVIQSLNATLPHLQQKRFLEIDCHLIPKSDGRAFLGALGSATSQNDSAVWSLPGVAHILKDDDGTFLHASLLSLLDRSQCGLILSLTPAEYLELIAQSSDLLHRFTKVDLKTPSEEQTHLICREHAERLSKQHSLSIPNWLSDQAVTLASNFLISEAHPAKAIRILQRACEDVDFDRTQLGKNRSELKLDDIVKVIAERTGIPQETIAGEAIESDFEALLTESVVGQPAATDEVSRELRLIKAGLNEPGKAASVMLFAGMTGVGKTELAKRIAEIYSSSRRLQTFTMANFTESHSASGIIGVPPGYVGFEQGGRLINELNADPYSVFLLDEAEKAHPNVWKPFLNLFDEGWIVDQRGVKAYADRAIFILTTNAGDRNIAQMVKTGKSHEEVVKFVKQALSKVKHERSSQPVFPPAFLARIGRVIVFNPLEEEAMIGIAERVCKKMQKQWAQKRNKRIDIPDDVIAAIGSYAYQLNEDSAGREGGRIVKKLVADIIEIRIQDAATENPDFFKNCEEIHLSLSHMRTTDSDEVPAVHVCFEDQSAATNSANLVGTVND